MPVVDKPCMDCIYLDMVKSIPSCALHNKLVKITDSCEEFEKEGEYDSEEYYDSM
jgi:hypothetical protein